MGYFNCFFLKSMLYSCQWTGFTTGMSTDCKNESVNEVKPIDEKDYNET